MMPFTLGKMLKSSLDEKSECINLGIFFSDPVFTAMQELTLEGNPGMQST